MLLYGSFQSLPRSGCQQCTWDCSRNKGICLPSLQGWKNHTNIFGWKDQIFHRGKKIKVVFFLLIIFSTSRAKTSPGGVGWTELWLVLLRDARSGVTGLSVGWERGFLLPVCPELCTNPRSCRGDPKEGVYTAQQARQESGLSAEPIEVCQAVLVVKVNFSFFQTRVFYSSLVSQVGV